MYSKRAHSHKEVSLGYIESGKTTITVDNQKYQLIPGDIVLIPAEIVHLCIPDNVKQFKFQMIYYDTTWWNSHFNITAGSFKTLAIPASDELKALIKEIVEGSLNIQVMEKKIVESITGLVVKFELNKEGMERSELEIDSIHRQIKEMPQISTSIEFMAEQTGLSKFSFIRKYAQRYGLTPHADVVNMRIQRAILLFDTDMDLITIALECGFADQSHFINQFKLYTGLRPREYRNSLSI
nr:MULTISPECIES: AraC family transcriptional regulator [unclassified Oceanispirochaeta]